MCEGGRFDACLRTQLREDVADVHARRLATDEQSIGDLLIRPTLGHQSEDL